MVLVHLPFLRVKGMAIFPFVFIREKSGKLDPVLINHERIHLRQQMELLVLPFLLFYFINYLYNLISTLDHQTAYRNIIFEKEAYDNEKDADYLKNRKIFRFLDYI